MEAQKNQSIDWVLVNFLDFEKSLNGGAKLPIHQKRKDAFARYTKAGFPTVAQEEWRYTNPAPIKDAGFALVKTQSKIDEQGIAPVPSLDVYRLIFVDGMPLGANVTGLPSGVTIEPLKGSPYAEKIATLASTDEQFTAINTSFVQDGIVLRVAKNIAVPKPVEVVWVAGSNSSKSLVCPRVYVEIEEGGACTFIERYVSMGGEGYFTNSVIEGTIAQNGSFNHYRIQDEALSAYHVSTIQFKTASDARVRTHTFSFGGKLVRNNVNIELDGSGCDVTMNGLSALTGNQHVDNHTLLDHAKPHCESHELYKGVYGDASQGVFSGTIIVREDAQKTNAIQSNRSLLLTNEASVNTKPQLKIWADDVKCTHGATIGQLDDDALFYIRARGVREADAKKMLIHAFASEVIKEVSVPQLRDYLEGMLEAKLSL